MANWIQTHSGIRFDYDNFTSQDILMSDIAHSLSNLCRYTGHCKYFYSVAQHSVLVSEWFDWDPGLALWGLLHDAAETYIGDINAPLKHYLKINGVNLVKNLEHRILRRIAAMEKLPWPMPPEIKEADVRIGVTEKEQLMEVQIPWPAVEGIKPLPVVIRPQPCALNITYFLLRYHDLKNRGDD